MITCKQPTPRIYAAGDICMSWKFTHAADACRPHCHSKMLCLPRLGWAVAKLSDLVMPWVTYTDPEVAHVGMYEHQGQGPKAFATDTTKNFPGGMWTGRGRMGS